MQWFFSVVASSVVALALGLYLTHPVSEPPAAETMRTNVPQPVPGAMETSSQDITTLRTEVALLREQVSALAAGNAGRAETPPQDFAALRKEVSALQRQVREQRHAGPIVARRQEERPVHDSRSDPADRADAERQRHAYMAALEANFWQEPADQRWSSAVAGAVQEALASDDTAQTALRSLECRSSTCRLELADETGQLAKVLPVFLMQLAQTLPYATANHVDYSDGSRGLILYMTHGSDDPLHTSR